MSEVTLPRKWGNIDKIPLKYIMDLNYRTLYT
jgi:hypothetical protein